MRALLYAIAAFLSFVLLMSFGCAQQKSEIVVIEPPMNNIVETPPVVPSLQCNEGNIVQKDECFLLLATEKSNPEICRNIYSIEKLDACYGMFANSSLEVCKKITGGDAKAACLMQNALSAKSEEICVLIENVKLREECLDKVVPPCMLILDLEKRNLCLAFEKNDYTICQSDYCFKEYALNRSNENACLLMSTPTERYTCVAVVRKSVAACGEAGLTKDVCFENAAKELGDLSGCGLATPGSEYSNRCYLYFAVKDSDMNICKKCHTEENRDACYMGYALQTANVSSCPKVINSLNRIDCYFKAARGNRMPSLCNPIATYQERSSCQAAAINLDAGPLPTDCQYVNIEDWKNKCYFRIARMTYNSSICQLISKGPDKDSCNTLFGLKDE